MAVTGLITVAHVGCADTSATQEDTSRVRIGVYDSRSVAVAYCGSELHNKQMKPLYEEAKKARAAGNKARVAELEAQGKAQQKLMHMQGFSTAPVESILALVKDNLDGVKAKAGVTALMSKWDEATLAKYPKAERVDVTMALVDLFHPDKRQLNRAVEVQKHQPIPLRDAEKIDD